jgi:hypothetical protein
VPDVKKVTSVVEPIILPEPDAAQPPKTSKLDLKDKAGVL